MERRRGATGMKALIVVLVGALAGVVLAAAPASAATTGAIYGKVNLPGGAPAVGFTVKVYDNAGLSLKRTLTTGADGRFIAGQLPAPASYKVQVTDPSATLPTQWHDGATTAGAATSIPIVAGVFNPLTVNLVEGGRLTGVVTNGAVPLANVYVGFGPAATPALLTYTVTDVNGAFTSPPLVPGSYKMLAVDAAWAANHATGYLPELWGTRSSMEFNAGLSYDVTVSATANAGTNVMAGHDCAPGVFFPGADLSGLDLSNRFLAGCDLFATTIQGTNFAGATLAGASSGFNTGTPAALPTDWFMLYNTMVGPGANLSWSVFFAAPFGSGRNLAGANLSNADLSAASLPAANLTGANLYAAYAASANLAGANLASADLFGATLMGAALTNVNLAGTSLRSADLTNANLTGATGVPVDHEVAIYFNTKCPTGVNSNANGGTCSGQGFP